jgi:CDP-diacylglycerol--serine O-phosphatidyltransferase
MAAQDQALGRARKQARFRRGMYLLPSLFTVGNIAAGYYSIMQTIAAIGSDGDARRHLDWAAIAILFAIPFDALDGRIARMTNTTSEFGKELDSLADVITFGVAPSLLAYIWGFHFLPDSVNPQLRHDLINAGAFFCFLFLIGGASRLARFNISHDAQPRNPGRPGRKYFVGMPIPAAAGLLASSVHFFQRNSKSCLVGIHSLDRHRRHVCIPDGQHLAVLVGQGDQLLAQPSIPDSAAAGGYPVCCTPVLTGSVVRSCPDLHVLRYLGAGGLLLVAPPAPPPHAGA